MNININQFFQSKFTKIPKNGSAFVHLYEHEKSMTMFTYTIKGGKLMGDRLLGKEPNDGIMDSDLVMISDYTYMVKYEIDPSTDSEIDLRIYEMSRKAKNNNCRLSMMKVKYYKFMKNQITDCQAKEFIITLIKLFRSCFYGTYNLKTYPDKDYVCHKWVTSLGEAFDEKMNGDEEFSDQMNNYTIANVLLPICAKLDAEFEALRFQTLLTDMRDDNSLVRIFYDV